MSGRSVEDLQDGEKGREKGTDKDERSVRVPVNRSEKHEYGLIYIEQTSAHAITASQDASRIRRAARQHARNTPGLESDPNQRDECLTDVAAAAGRTETDMP